MAGFGSSQIAAMPVSNGARYGAPAASGTSDEAISQRRAALDRLRKGADTTYAPSTSRAAPQPAPDLGSILRQLEHGRAAQLPPASQPPQPPRVEAAPVPRSSSFVNPTLPANAADPTVVRGDDGFFYAHTTQVGELHIPTLRSKDLTRWEFVGDAMPQLPAWVQNDTWAPETVKTGDHFTMFYSGRGHDGKMRIGYAIAATPAGPFNDRGILVEHQNPGYTIDPEIFQEGDRTFLYWGSADGNAAAGVEGIRGQEIRVEPDGSITRLGSPVVTKLKDADDRQLVEAPNVVKHGDSYYMFYSDGHFLGTSAADSYALNVARARSPLGPFTEHRRVMSSSGDAFGPGHNAVITDDAGQDWSVYHARVGSPDAPRQMMLDRIDWVDGWPVINGGNGPTSGWQTGPTIRE